MSPRISIITTSFNAASTIATTLDSVLTQEFGDFEHLIIDGASSDETLAVVEGFRARYEERSKILRVYSQKDSGLYEGMNRGLKQARGEIVGFLNADDFYTHSRVLDFIAWAFDKPDGIGVCYGNVLYVDSALSPLRQLKGAPFSPLGFKLGAHPPHPSFYARRELYTRYGGFSLRYGIAADYELMLRLLYKHRAKSLYIDETLVTMRAGGVSNASLANIVRANLECAKAWRDLGLSLFPAFIPLKVLRKLGERLITLLGGGRP